MSQRRESARTCASLSLSLSRVLKLATLTRFLFFERQTSSVHLIDFRKWTVRAHIPNTCKYEVRCLFLSLSPLLC